MADSQLTISVDDRIPQHQAAPGQPGPWSPEFRAAFTKAYGLSPEDAARAEAVHGTRVMPNPGESPEEYVSRLESMGFDNARSIQLNNMLNPDSFKTPEQKEADRVESERLATQKLLKEFAAEMMKPFDPNDPQYARKLADVQARTRGGFAARGINPNTSGLSKGAVARAYLDASNEIQDRRNSIGLQALGMQMADANSLQGLREQQYQFDAGAREQAAMRRYEQEKAGSQGLWSALGGVAGGIVGGVATLGNPMGIAAGAGVGSALGGGLAGTQYGPPPSYSRNRYSSGGLSGGGY